MRGGEVIKKYKLQKTKIIAGRLEALQGCDDETLAQVSAVILEKLEFYDTCLKSWDNPRGTYSADEIETAKKCCNAAIDMADAIVNELRILFIEEKEKARF